MTTTTTTTTRLTPLDVTAVVAAFRPDAEAAGNIRRLAGQVGRIVVVDDGSGPSWDDFFAELEDIPGTAATIVRLPQNRGIAHALNRGVRSALQTGCRAVVTFDQDSQADDGYVSAMVRAAERLAGLGRPFGALAAGVQSSLPVRAVGRADRGDALTPTREAIQSGLFIPASTFSRAGVFDETLFIDCVDTDFVARAAAIGLPTYLNRHSGIEHPLGRRLATSGIRVSRRGDRSFAFHPPWRRYYISRNRAVMLSRHGVRTPARAVSGLSGEAVQLLRCLVFGPEKRRQGMAVAIGVADALRGRRGRLEGLRAVLLGAPQ